MISNQILQSTIEGIKNISRVELCVADVDGKEIVSTSPMGDCVKAVGEFANSPADSQEIQGKQYFKIYDEQQLEYILIVSGVGEDVYTVGKMATFHIQGLLVAYKERFDKDNFIKNLLYLPSDLQVLYSEFLTADLHRYRLPVHPLRNILS